jgi:acetamidase/formamidase
MKVRELIVQLEKLDSNLDVLCFEDGPVPIEGPNPGPFDIIAVSVENVERTRINGKPTISFISDEKLRPVALIGITSDF